MEKSDTDFVGLLENVISNEVKLNTEYFLSVPVMVTEILKWKKLF